MIMKASSKRRRGKEQIRREKEEEEAKKQADEAKLNQFDAMQQQMNQMQHQLNDATVMHDQVNALVISGVLAADANGNLDLNADDDKFEHIITEKIKTSKQKRQLANANLNQQIDL